MFIVIDGNIGSGKSTVLDNISRDYKVVKERISEWPLEEFYKDPCKWAFPLQIKILQTMTKPTAPCFHERCLQSSKYVFWKHLVETTQVTHIEDVIYQDLFKKYEWECDVYVYLRCSPEKCLKNISKRIQDGDSHISLEYLQSIHEKYEEYVKTIPNVLIIDAEQDENSVYNNIFKVLGCLRQLHI